MTTATPRPRGDRATEVYTALRDLIVDGKLSAGSRIIEAEIAERLAVSRTPVRAALHRLQMEGYVVSGEGGARTRLSVAPLTKHDGEEIFHVVAEVEGLAAWYAAQLGAEPRGRLAAELRAINADLRHAAESDSPDPHRYFQLDKTFHQRYVEAAGRRRVLLLHDAIKPQVHRYNHVYTNVLVDTILTSVAEHEGIVEAIEMGNPESAQQAVQTNWRNAGERLAAMIDRAGERGIW